MKKVIALDIGGTNTRVALINENYEIEKELIKDTVVGSLDNFLASVSSIIEEAIPDRTDVVAIAAGVPGRVRIDGYIESLPNIHIEHTPLAEYLSGVFHLPCFVANDAEVASLAEANVGPLKGAASLYFVTISTGVGGALTQGGRLVHSSYEVGHTMTPYQGEVHEFEHLCSGTGLVSLCAKNGLNVKSAKEFFDAYLAKDELATKVYRDWIALLASWFSMVQETFEPEVFALTGGVMKSADIFFEDLRKACPSCNIQVAGCGQRAGMLGAAVYGFQRA